MLKKISLILFALVCVSGCMHAHNKAVANMNTWMGLSKDKVILEKGIPTRQQKLSDGTEILEYATSRQEYNGSGIGLPVMTGTTPMMLNSGGTLDTYSCLVTFYISTTGNVYNWKFVGNDCY